MRLYNVGLYVVRGTESLYATGERAFSLAGRAAWNSIPEHIRSEPDAGVFRKLLKKTSFNLDFNVN